MAEISYEELRSKLADKTRYGYAGIIRKIITSYGADKLSDVDEKYYKEIFKKVEVLCERR